MTLDNIQARLQEMEQKPHLFNDKEEPLLS